MKINKYSLCFSLIFILFADISAANPHRYKIDAKKSLIKCTVSYLVVPKIEGVFDDFSGVIYYDPEDISNSSVLIKVETKSVHTGNTKWDKIIRSRRVLNAAVFPLMVFKSSEVLSDESGLSTAGSLDLHGIVKDMTLPFSISGPFNDGDGEYIKAKGKWPINRKEFGIFWHEVLDKGGIIVGNNVIVDWNISAYRE